MTLRHLASQTLDGRDAPGVVIAVDGAIVTAKFGPIKHTGHVDQFEPWSIHRGRSGKDT